MSLYEVGRPYIPGRSTYPEAVQYAYRAGGHELLMWLGSPTAREIRDLRQGPAQFALFVRQPVIVLLYRFGEMPWSDAPTTWHLVPEAERQRPPSATEAGIREPHALLQLIVVDADTGLVRVLRACSWSPAFTAAVHLALAEQADAPWPGRAAYDAAVNAIYADYPTTERLLAAATIRTTGGR